MEKNETSFAKSAAFRAADGISIMQPTGSLSSNGMFAMRSCAIAWISSAFA